MKKITYYVQRYRPDYEAISKEVQLLANHFSQNNTVKVHDLHLDGLLTAKFSLALRSFHFAYYPLLLPYTYLLSRKSDLNHIYTSLGDLPYLSVLDLQRTILTAAASCHLAKIQKRMKYLSQLRKIIVESGKQQQELISLGMPPDKIELIYPPVDLAAFSYEPKIAGPFTILYASCPTRKEDFEKRGIYLLLDCAEREKKVQFLLPWRKGAYDQIQREIRQRARENVQCHQGIHPHMNNQYALAHGTIIPYTRYDDYLKLIPNSAIESLAAGKPLLVSTKTEMAEIVKNEKCGVIFEPTPEDLTRAIKELQRHYHSYQRNCRKTAEKYFSHQLFLKKYEQVYSSITAR